MFRQGASFNEAMKKQRHTAGTSHSKLTQSRIEKSWGVVNLKVDVEWKQDVSGEFNAKFDACSVGAVYDAVFDQTVLETDNQRIFALVRFMVVGHRLSGPIAIEMRRFSGTMSLEFQGKAIRHHGCFKGHRRS